MREQNTKNRKRFLSLLVLLCLVSTTPAESKEWFGGVKDYFWKKSETNAQKAPPPLTKTDSSSEKTQDHTDQELSTKVTFEAVGQGKNDKTPSTESWGTWFLDNGVRYGVTTFSKYAGSYLGGQFFQNNTKNLLDTRYDKLSWLNPWEAYEKANISLQYANNLQESYDWGTHVGGIVGSVAGGVFYDIAKITGNTLYEIYTEYQGDKEPPKDSRWSTVGWDVMSSVASRSAETGLTKFASDALYKFAKNTVKYYVREKLANPVITGTLGAILGENILKKVASWPLLGYAGEAEALDKVSEGIVNFGIQGASYFGSKVVVGGGSYLAQSISNWYWGSGENIPQEVAPKINLDKVIDKKLELSELKQAPPPPLNSNENLYESIAAA